jgi:hypothetical protein
VPMMQKAMQLK